MKNGWKQETLEEAVKMTCLRYELDIDKSDYTEKIILLQSKAQVSNYRNLDDKSQDTKEKHRKMDGSLSIDHFLWSLGK